MNLLFFMCIETVIIRSHYALAYYYYGLRSGNLFQLLYLQCSVSCGSGIQKRSVNCEKVNEQRPENREIVSESYCVEETRPLLRQECQQSPCPDRYHWETGPWGEVRNSL